MTDLNFEIKLISNITERHLGLTPDALNVKTRTGELVLGRMLVCNILMDGGLTPAKIAEFFKQHRTNFYHYRKKHLIYVGNSKIYPYYIELYNSILNEYKERSSTNCFATLLNKLQVINDIDNTVSTLIQQKQLLQQSIND
tara:strand:+ start:1042 stop:1464 length:423 start_codon:yes stop_codon:yes gene_type:complete